MPTAFIELDGLEGADNPSAQRVPLMLDLGPSTVLRKIGGADGAGDAAPTGFGERFRDVVEVVQWDLILGPRPRLTLLDHPTNRTVARQASEELVGEVVDAGGFGMLGPQPQGDLHHDHRELSKGARLANEELLRGVVDEGGFDGS